MKFQRDPDERLMVVSLKAAQTAITLTGAQRVLMIELDWAPATGGGDRALKLQP